MSENPWLVETIQSFLFLNCPECHFKTKEKNFFQDHATKKHPRSSELRAGKPRREDDIEVEF